MITKSLLKLNLCSIISLQESTPAVYKARFLKRNKRTACRRAELLQASKIRKLDTVGQFCSSFITPLTLATSCATATTMSTTTSTIPSKGLSSLVNVTASGSNVSGLVMAKAEPVASVRTNSALSNAAAVPAVTSVTTTMAIMLPQTATSDSSVVASTAMSSATTQVVTTAAMSGVNNINQLLSLALNHNCATESNTWIKQKVDCNTTTNNKYFTNERDSKLNTVATTSAAVLQTTGTTSTPSASNNRQVFVINKNLKFFKLNSVKKAKLVSEEKYFVILILVILKK